MPLVSVQTTRFKRDVRKVMKSGKKIELLEDIVRLLVNGRPLPIRHRDHALTGNWVEFRECHIQPDWLLIYRTDGDTLTLTRTGSHAELFS
jgi:mRNA interferase YafQ